MLTQILYLFPSFVRLYDISFVKSLYNVTSMIIIQHKLYTLLLLEMLNYFKFSYKNIYLKLCFLRDLTLPLFDYTY